MYTTEQQRALDLLEQFSERPPTMVKRQFTEPAWSFITGEQRSIVGESSLQLSVRNFLYYNLGPPVTSCSHLPEYQKRRKVAFDKFGEAMKNRYPNCWYWRNETADRGKAWAPLMNNMADAVKARKRQNYRRGQEDNRDFWLAESADEQVALDAGLGRNLPQTTLPGNQGTFEAQHQSTNSQHFQNVTSGYGSNALGGPPNQATGTPQHSQGASSGYVSNAFGGPPNQATGTPQHSQGASSGYGSNAFSGPQNQATGYSGNGLVGVQNQSGAYEAAQQTIATSDKNISDSAVLAEQSAEATNLNASNENEERRKLGNI